MNLTTEQLAELLAGIARAQQSIIDAMDKSQPDFRGTYLAPALNVAANLRIPEVRLLDLPSRILLRSQGRVPMDQATIEKSLAEALGMGAQTLKPLNAPGATPPAARPSAPDASLPPVAAATAATSAAAAGPGAAAAIPDLNLDNFLDN
jgi:hypothetical protein